MCVISEKKRILVLLFVNFNREMNKIDREKLLHSKLKEYFGFSSFKGNQQAVIENVLDGGDTFVLNVATATVISQCVSIAVVIVLAKRSGHRYLPLQDDISSVAYWYSDNLDDIYPAFPDADYLEIR